MVGSGDRDFGAQGASNELLPRAGVSNVFSQAESKLERAAGSLRDGGLELDLLAGEAGQADVLREELARCSMVAELNPEDIGPSFIADRLDPTGDLQYRQLVDSIRREGQKIPILVRPAVDAGHKYQLAYGHRRWRAARDLNIKVRAIVQELTDSELVIAQGKENSDRRTLSFIERALFAAKLNERGFDRPTINAALAVQSAETTRLLAVAAAVPAQIVRAVGPAPKAGRTRWMELVGYFHHQKEATQLAIQIANEPSFRGLGTDARFAALIAAFRAAASDPIQSEAVSNSQGQPVVRVTRSGERYLRLSIDERLVPGFGAYLIRTLPEVICRFEQHDKHVGP